MSNLLTEARAIKDWIVALRRELHRYPETCYEEVRTSALVRRTLDELHIPYRAPLAQTGVVATLSGGPGPCIALRADMDALPIREESGEPFSSTIDGKMHACGHDCHTAMLLGAARLLKQRESSLKGTVKLFFQPAEEGGAGGRKLCEEGAMDNPSVQRIFGLHVWPDIPSQSIGSRPGAFLAAAGEIAITILGKGGHAAAPHRTCDPVMTAAKVICELQTIVSRECDPLEPAVASLTSIHGGAAFNVIPQEVRLLGTIRSQTLPGMLALRQRAAEIATQVAAANRCTARVEFPGNDYPPTHNDAHCWNVAQKIGRELLGADHVHEVPPVMGGEDFAFYLQHKPGVFVALGIRNESAGSIHGLHTPKFKMDEDTLPTGTALHVAFALESLDELQSR
ncbi:MAG TPA: amidohydrolase [Planctomycetota bacterium]|nr:amidohydrolase [Planctomycetota bacterium]